MNYSKEKNVLICQKYSDINQEEMIHWDDYANENNGNLFFIFETEKNEIPESQEAVFNKLFKEGISDFSFEMTFYSKNRLSEKIENYIEDMNINLIIIGNISVSVELFYQQIKSSFVHSKMCLEVI